VSATHRRLAQTSVVIVDEAHRLKEPKARLTLALKKFIKPTCFALTGTLIQNRARPAVHVRAHANSQMEEIWSLLDFVSPLSATV
jgi:SNF2 family DNA or RNA helicase